MASFDTLKDSGGSTEFETGSRRDARVGKGRFDLIPPSALRRLAKHYENGANRYGARNWEKGQPMHCYFDSAVRHLYVYMENIMMGREHQEDHLAAAMWNVAGLIHTEEMIEAGGLPRELNDICDMT